MAQMLRRQHPLQRGVSYHVHHPSLILSYVNIIMQIIYIKGRAQICIIILAAFSSAVHD